MRSVQQSGRRISFASSGEGGNSPITVKSGDRGYKEDEIYEDDLASVELVKEQKLEQEVIKPFKPHYMLIPSFLDMFEHVLRNVSNSLIAPSVSQMLRSSVVIFAEMLCVFFLKKRLFRHHFVSIAAIVLGLFFVGLSQAIKPENESSKHKTYTSTEIILGISLQLVG